MTFDLGEYDYHDKIDVKDDDLKLSWRMDPEESWSDWTISVEVKQQVDFDENLIAESGLLEQDGDADLVELQRDYHVHKAQVCSRICIMWINNMNHDLSTCFLLFETLIAFHSNSYQ